jgi:hypothetical protein
MADYLGEGDLTQNMNVTDSKPWEGLGLTAPTDTTQWGTYTGGYEPYTPDWYNYKNKVLGQTGGQSYDQAVSRFQGLDQAGQLGDYENMYGQMPSDSTDLAKWFGNVWKGGDVTQASQAAANEGFLDKFMGGIAENLNPLTGMLAVLGGGLAFGGLGGLGGAASGGIDAGLGALEGGISAADAAAGMLPEFGTNAGYAAGMGSGGGMWDFGDLFSNAFGGGDSGLGGMFDTTLEGGVGPSFDLGTPGVGDAGAFDQWGSHIAGGPEGTGIGTDTIFGPAGPNGTGIDWSKVPMGTGSSGSSNILDQITRSLTQQMPGSNAQTITRLAGNLYDIINQKSMEGKYNNAVNGINANQFPFKDFQKQAYDWVDPAKRYQMLLDNPGYQAANAYIDNAQHRRNARTGDLKSGYGDALRADVIGKNAAAWDAQNFGQIKDMSGMGFNNANAQAVLAQMIPAMYAGRAQVGTNIGNTLAKGLPDILSWFGFGG